MSSVLVGNNDDDDDDDDDFDDLITNQHHLSGTGSGIDGFCTDPENVPECADYYVGNEEVLQQKSLPPTNPGRVRTHRFY